MDVPLLDLRAQYREIAGEVGAAIAEVAATDEGLDAVQAAALNAKLPSLEVLDRSTAPERGVVR